MEINDAGFVRREYARAPGQEFQRPIFLAGRMFVLTEEEAHESGIPAAVGYEKRFEENDLGWIQHVLVPHFTLERWGQMRNLNAPRGARR